VLWTNFYPLLILEINYTFCRSQHFHCYPCSHYGTGALGGLRGIIDPQNSQQILLFRLERHCQRLSASAKFLHYDLPADKIQHIIVDFVKKTSQLHRFTFDRLSIPQG
jgi:branched-subunit amino acid aminotransferase/4-amino-4-deoxychorismate lyase